VLGASGHIARVINPPAKKKRNYWTLSGTDAPDADPDRWFAAAESVPGSWWPAWIDWLTPHSGRLVTARNRLRSEFFFRTDFRACIPDCFRATGVGAPAS
jgi:polyhydroxyalkanoate synthase